MLTPEQIDDAASVLVKARLDNVMIDAIPAACRPRSLHDAYGVQDRMAELLGWRHGGWFCACTNLEIQSMLGLAEPYYARLFEQFILDSPARLDPDDFPPMVLECEFGFRLAHDLPARSAPYSRAEVETAIATVHPTIEVVAGHLRDWPNQDVYSVIADNGTDGALIVGPGTEDWRGLDLTGTEVVLSINGREERRGSGANVLSDPLAAFVWLANARSRAGGGLRAGDIHNTGTATAIYWVTPGDDAVADFGDLGEVRLSIPEAGSRT